MTIGADLFSSILPPGVYITLHGLENGEQDNRKVTIRLKPHGRRSVSASVEVSRYSPEDSILRAVTEMCRTLSVVQATITPTILRQCLEQAVAAYVEPF